jgi:hypothetical protein
MDERKKMTDLIDLGAVRSLDTTPASRTAKSMLGGESGIELKNVSGGDAKRRKKGEEGISKKIKFES